MYKYFSLLGLLLALATPGHSSQITIEGQDYLLYQGAKRPMVMRHDWDPKNAYENAFENIYHTQWPYSRSYKYPPTNESVNALWAHFKDYYAVYFAGLIDEEAEGLPTDLQEAGAMNTHHRAAHGAFQTVIGGRLYPSFSQGNLQQQYVEYCLSPTTPHHANAFVANAFKNVEDGIAKQGIMALWKVFIDAELIIDEANTRMEHLHLLLYNAGRLLALETLGHTAITNECSSFSIRPNTGHAQTLRDRWSLDGAASNAHENIGNILQDSFPEGTDWGLAWPPTNKGVNAWWADFNQDATKYFNVLVTEDQDAANDLVESYGLPNNPDAQGAPRTTLGPQVFGYVTAKQLLTIYRSFRIQRGTFPNIFPCDSPFLTHESFDKILSPYLIDVDEGPAKDAFKALWKVYLVHEVRLDQASYYQSPEG